jgi:hypothetical protein
LLAVLACVVGFLLVAGSLYYRDGGVLRGRGRWSNALVNIAPGCRCKAHLHHGGPDTQPISQSKGRAGGDRTTRPIGHSLKVPDWARGPKVPFQGCLGQRPPSVPLHCPSTPLSEARTHIGASAAAGLAINASWVGATSSAVLRSLGPPGRVSANSETSAPSVERTQTPSRSRAVGSQFSVWEYSPAVIIYLGLCAYVAVQTFGSGRDKG